MSKYSALSLIRHAFSNNKNWQLAIKDAEPKKSYDAIIVGGGGHGLASAYYLARNHNLKNIAVVEKGWIGGGNTARNTTIVRSNYLWTEASLLYEKSLKLWEGLSQDLNFNVMFSQRGVYNLGHTLQDMRDIERRVSANQLNGIDAEVVDAKQIKKNIPSINTSTSARYPILGASLQRRAGVARHDAVAWGYARAAAQLGVDIIQQCEVTGILKSNNQVYGLETSKGRIESNKIGLVVAGHASVLALTRNFIEVKGLKQMINFGCNKVRFYSVVNEGDRVRARGTLMEAKQRGSMIQLLSKITVEVENKPKPACVVEMLVFLVMK